MLRRKGLGTHNAIGQVSYRMKCGRGFVSSEEEWELLKSGTGWDWTVPNTKSRDGTELDTRT